MYSFIHSDLYVADSSLAVRFQPVFSASCLRTSSSVFAFKQPAVITVKITSHLIDQVTVDSIAVSLSPEPDCQPELAVLGLLDRQTSRSSDQSLSSSGSANSANILDTYSRIREVVRLSSLPVDLVEYLELENDRQTVAACGVMCQAVMRRSYSNSTQAAFRDRVVTRRGDWDLAFTVSNCVLQPGDNVVQLTTQASFCQSQSTAVCYLVHN